MGKIFFPPLQLSRNSKSAYCNKKNRFGERSVRTQAYLEEIEIALALMKQFKRAYARGKESIQKNTVAETARIQAEQAKLERDAYESMCRHS